MSQTAVHAPNMPTVQEAWNQIEGQWGRAMAERVTHADAAMALILRLGGETEIDEALLRERTVSYLEGWWRVRRCEALMMDLKAGKDPAEVLKEAVDTDDAKADLATWLGWMKAEHEGLQDPASADA